jgi:hypothetical protein
MSLALKNSLRTVRGFGRNGAGARRVAACFAIASSAAVIASAVADAKQPGSVHCYGGWCHRVSTLDEVAGIVGRRGVVKASYYDDCRRDRFNTCGLTSSGALFEPHRPDNAASPIFPDGSILLVFNRETGKAAVVRINSAGPYHGDRTLDVSRATATALGFERRGVAELEVSVLKAPQGDEARYKKLRRYPPVPGYMGVFSSFEDAHLEAMRLLALELDRQGKVTTASADVETVVPWWPSRLTGEAQLRLPALNIVAQPLQATEVIAASPPQHATLNPVSARPVIRAGSTQIAAVTPVIGADEVSISARDAASWRDRLVDFADRARDAARPKSTPSRLAMQDAPSGGLSDRFWSFVQYAKDQASLTRRHLSDDETYVSRLDDGPASSASQ